MSSNRRIKSAFAHNRIVFRSVSSASVNEGDSPIMEVGTFYFEVVATNGATFATHVKAADLDTAKQFIANFPNVARWNHIQKSEIPADMRLGEPHFAVQGTAAVDFSLPPTPDFEIVSVGYKPQ